MVAAELRNLAQRCASAAKEIKTLISDSIASMDAAARLVDEAGMTMGEMVSSVEHATDIRSEISISTQEQTVGIDQVNQAITQTGEVTRQNAALVEQAAATAGSMQNQAANFAQIVEIFQAGQPSAAVRRHR